MSRKLSTAARRLSALTLGMAMVLGALFLIAHPTGPAEAEEPQQTVRVGWYESPFNSTDQFGRRSGYAYEYQRKVAAYAGWSYEYVEGSWPDLLQMLVNGEIDLLSDVSYSPERTNILYSSLPMGTEQYYVFVPSGSKAISLEDLSTWNDKLVGVNKGSVQEGLFLDWEQERGISAQVVELTVEHDEALHQLQQGELDAYITLESFCDPTIAEPICSIGSSDFHFAVSSARPDLIAELDSAMRRIQEENRHYNQELYEKYIGTSYASRFLAAGEQEWLEAHGVIRVGYQDNYLAFCAEDKTTGELTGALKDYLAYVSNGFENAHVEFEAVAYPTASDAINALKAGEVDCMFPANFTEYDSELLGVSMSPALMSTEMCAVVRASDQQSFVHADNVTVAVNEGNPNYDMFLVDHFPDWNTAHYADTPTCLRAVAAGEADCILISNYRYNNISELCDELHLVTMSTGVDMDYCLAVKQRDAELSSIISRAAGLVPESAVNAALNYYSREDAKITFADFLEDNMVAVMSATVAIFVIVLTLLLLYIRAGRRANNERLVAEGLSKQVFVDALTSTKNKGAFDNYLEGIQKRLDAGEDVKFAIGVFDCDDLKSVNDQYGHDKGDTYIKTASSFICRAFKHSPVFRIGGDEFAAIVQNEDLASIDEIASSFDEAQADANAAVDNRWEQVRVSLGIAVHDPLADSSANDTVRRADKAMYERKRSRKVAR